MVAGAAISGDLSDKAWLGELRNLGEDNGYFSDLGDGHAAVMIEQSHDVLFVAFESVFGARATSETGMPVAFDVCERRGWSHLTILTQKQDWFRSESVWSHIDELDDLGFFEDFDRVIFYGAGMCAYAAAVYSVAAPGASVILVSPQATLDRQRTHWDERFPSTRRIDFTSRYGFAPDMIEAAGLACVIFDPEESEDAMHASLFQGDNVIHFPYRRGGAGSIEADLRAMSLISAISESAANGSLTASRLARHMRQRRRHVPYLRALLSRVLIEDRPALTAALCRSVLKHQPIPRFQQQLEKAEERLGKATAPDQSADSQLS